MTSTELLDDDDTQLLLQVVRAVAERQQVQIRIAGLLQDQLDRLNLYNPENDELAHAVRQYIGSIRVNSGGPGG